MTLNVKAKKQGDLKHLHSTVHCYSFCDGAWQVLKTEFHFKDIVQYYSPNVYWGAWESFCKTRNQFMSAVFH